MTPAALVAIEPFCSAATAACNSDAGDACKKYTGSTKIPQHLGSAPLRSGADFGTPESTTRQL
jgi:hypothetical protein